jgi:hypothetical protein
MATVSAKNLKNADSSLSTPAIFRLRFPAVSLLHPRVLSPARNALPGYRRSPSMTPRRHRGGGTGGRIRRAVARLLLSSCAHADRGARLGAVRNGYAYYVRAGSLIIPMDTTSQNFGMWKAYGLVYKLLQNGIPVHWAIGNPKVPNTYTGTDFTSGAATIQRLGTATTVSPYTYTGRAVHHRQR